MATDVFLIRRTNLRALIQQHDGATNLAKVLGYSSPSFLSQMVGPHPTRQVTEKVARQIESRLLLPVGWLDKPLPDYQSRVDEGHVRDTVLLVGQTLRETGTATTPEQFAELVALVHERGGADETYLRRLIHLINPKARR